MHETKNINIGSIISRATRLFKVEYKHLWFYSLALLLLNILSQINNLIFHLLEAQGKAIQNASIFIVSLIYLIALVYAGTTINIGFIKTIFRIMEGKKTTFKENFIDSITFLDEKTAFTTKIYLLTMVLEVVIIFIHLVFGIIIWAILYAISPLDFIAPIIILLFVPSFIFFSSINLITGLYIFTVYAIEENKKAASYTQLWKYFIKEPFRYIKTSISLLLFFFAIQAALSIPIVFILSFFRDGMSNETSKYIIIISQSATTTIAWQLLTACMVYYYYTIKYQNEGFDLMNALDGNN